jgi:DNA gyrase subunit A
MIVIRRDAALCTVTQKGFAKRTELTDFPVQKRGGLGTPATTVSGKTGTIVTAKELLPGDELMVSSAKGSTVRLVGDDLPAQGPKTQGNRVLELEPGDYIVEVTRVAEKEERDEEGDAEPLDAADDDALADDQFELLSIADE